MNNSEKRFHILIIGSGVIAMICAAYCRFQNLSYQLLTLRETPNSRRNRHFSLTPTTEAILKKLSLWEQMDESVYGFFDSIKILDDDGENKLSFNNIKNARGPMSWVVREDLITNALFENVGQGKTSFDSVKLLDNSKNGITLIDNNKITYKANLLLVTENIDLMADDLLQTPLRTRRYNQTALVGDIKTEKAHENVALQWFTKDGILALLPMNEINAYSMVYSHSKNLKASTEDLDVNFLPVALLNRQVSRVLSFENLSSYELIERWRTSVHDQSVIWLGSAAFSFHPLAGQGLNFGIKSVNKLFEFLRSYENIIDPIKKQKCLSRFNKLVINDATKLVGFINVTKNFFTIGKLNYKKSYRCILKIIDKSSLVKSIAVKLAR